MFAQIHLYEDGKEIGLYNYTDEQLTLLQSVISSLTGCFNIDMYYGRIYDVNMTFYDNYCSGSKTFTLRPRYGWSRVHLEVAFEMLFTDEEPEYMSEDDDRDSYS
jgi:hypothetical protein